MICGEIQEDTAGFTFDLVFYNVEVGRIFFPGRRMGVINFDR